jgi:basic membrane protein A
MDFKKNEEKEMLKKFYPIFSVLIVLAMLLSACQTAAPAAEEPAAAEPAAAEPAAESMSVKACQVTDMGGIDDKSFNATAWKGIADAVETLGAEGKYLESQQQTDYEKNLNAFIEEKCDLIVSVGFALGDATAAAAEANPDMKFAIVDYAYDPAYTNVVGLAYDTDGAAFLAGYLAAGVTKTGIVGTFGGNPYPTVTIFMDGFAMGVEYYNEQKGTDVQVLGWDPATQEGLFTGNFESTDDGRSMAQALMDEGADIIMPVAGPVGLGSAAAIQENGNAYLIGVDYDWFVSAPNYANIILTSVLKNMDKSVYNVVESVMDGTYEGGTAVGTLENGGVGLADFHDLDSVVSDELKTELETIKAGIIAGTIATSPNDEVMAEPAAESMSVKACQVTDMGGIDDKSFNATAWKGIADAVETLGAEGKYLESQQQTDYEKNLNAFIEEKCDLIVSVGFALGDATAAAAEANPDMKFAIVDYAYDPAYTNVVGLAYDTDGAAFLAGYLAAGVTKTGIVGTFGGNPYPTVTIFMDGFAMGVEYYNEQKGTDVQVLGWDPATQEGLFTGNFESTDDGRSMAQALMDEGADIIMPVAGPVGLGSAAAIQENGNAYLIGVDYDWFVSAPNYANIILTSVLKNMDKSVYNVVESVMDGTYEGGTAVGTLENGGVGLADFHDLDSVVSDELKTELETIKAGIIAGDIQTSSAE